MSQDIVTAYGFTAVPRAVETLLSTRPNPEEPAPEFLIQHIVLPETPLAKSVMAYASKELGEETFNHSMRVYYYGIAIATHAFPSWLPSAEPSVTETYFLACMLHDIGTTEKNISATMMSFEFYGGLLALDMLAKEGAPKEQAEGVAEAVMRHQDLGETGTLTMVTALVQLATIFDNMGGHPELINRKTVEAVVAVYPRKNWNKCFAATIRKENSLKPWAHTTHLGEEDFPTGVYRNKLMAEFE